MFEYLDEYMGKTYSDVPEEEDGSDKKEEISDDMREMAVNRIYEPVSGNVHMMGTDQNGSISSSNEGVREERGIGFFSGESGEK